MHALICAGKLPIWQAQREIATEWIAAYQKYNREAERPPRVRESTSDTSLGRAMRIAARSIEHDAKMIAQRSDCLRMFGVWIAVGDANNDRTESIAFSPAGRKHGGHQGIALTVAQREKKRHLPLNMCCQPDLLLEENS